MTDVRTEILRRLEGTPEDGLRIRRAYKALTYLTRGGTGDLEAAANLIRPFWEDLATRIGQMA